MLVRNFIFWLSTKKAVTDAISRRGARTGFARRFIAGETLEEALEASRDLNGQGRAISLNHLGENVSTQEEARKVRDGYIEMLRALESQRITGNISIKLTQLGLDLGRDFCEQMTGEICAAAREIGRDIEIDMEGSAYTGVTLDIFEATRRRFDNAGLAIQAYLHRTEKDIERLRPLAPKLRLVKGAYREPANVAIQKKSDVDKNYCLLIDRLLSGGYFPAIATHDPAMLDYARGRIRSNGIGADRYEFQMIYGIRRDLQQQMRNEGHALRIYVPYGTEWCPYFMRRLSERPANCWFVLRNLVAELTPGSKQQG
jgi:proline dehydrogenase